MGETILEKATNDKTINKKLYSSIESLKNIPSNRFNVPHKLLFRYHENIEGDVEITAIINKNCSTSFQIQSDSTPLNKCCGIKFTAKTSILEPFKVYWQVANTGDEAR